MSAGPIVVPQANPGAGYRVTDDRQHGYLAPEAANGGHRAQEYLSAWASGATRSQICSNCFADLERQRQTRDAVTLTAKL